MEEGGGGEEGGMVLEEIMDDQDLQKDFTMGVIEMTIEEVRLEHLEMIFEDHRLEILEMNSEARLEVGEEEDLTTEDHHSITMTALGEGVGGVEEIIIELIKINSLIISTTYRPKKILLRRELYSLEILSSTSPRKKCDVFSDATEYLSTLT